MGLLGVNLKTKYSWGIVMEFFLGSNWMLAHGET